MNFSTRTSARFGVLGVSALLALGLSACGNSNEATSSASSTAKASASASLKATASASASAQASSQAQSSTTPAVTEASASAEASAVATEAASADASASSAQASESSAAPSATAGANASSSAAATQQADPGVGDPNSDGAGSDEPEGETFEELLPEGTDASNENEAALALAQQYLKDSPFSASGLRTVLIGSYASESAADYAIANLNVDWNEQAKKAAQAYVDSLAFSEKALTEILQDPQIGFTAEQAQYAMSNIKVDWNQEALQAAESYSAIQSMSSDDIRKQLLEGEGFTAEQVEYAMSNL